MNSFAQIALAGRIRHVAADIEDQSRIISERKIKGAAEFIFRHRAETFLRHDRSLRIEANDEQEGAASRRAAPSTMRQVTGDHLTHVRALDWPLPRTLRVRDNGLDVPREKNAAADFSNSRLTAEEEPLQ